TDQFVETTFPQILAIKTPQPAWDLVNLIAFFSLIVLMLIVIPAVTCALLFRGGILFHSFGFVIVKNDGFKASRRRTFWRSIMAWSPFFGLVIFSTVLAWVSSNIFGKSPDARFWITLMTLASWAAAGVLMVFSNILPARSWQDRLAGTSVV